MWLRLLVLSVFVTACDARMLPVEEDAGVPDAGPVDAGARIRVLTFNVHLLFDTYCQSGHCTAADFEGLPTQAQFDAKVGIIAAGIRSTGADLVVLQEVENQAALDALSAKLSDILPGATLGETGAPGSVDVAVLSRAPIGPTTKHRNTVLTRPDGTTTNFSREFYEVHVQLEGREVIAFAAHFRSKVSDDPGRRLAEAQAAHTIVVDTANAHPNALVLLAGDLNDTPGSEPIEALESDGALIRVARDNPVADQATYIFNGKGNAIDHIFRAAKSPGSTVPDSVKVLKGSGGYAGSDHFALQADFFIQ